MDGEIKVERIDPIAVVTISRPAKMNSVTHDMLSSFDEKMSHILNDPDVLVIILTGEGKKAFSAGFDLKMITSLEGEEIRSFYKLLEGSIRQIRDSRNSITIAAINGHAIGFGAMVSCACDFRFYAENATFRLPEVDLGIFPGAGASSNLIYLVGPARAKEILLSGRTITAAEAKRIGLAHRVFPQDELMSKTMIFAKQLTEKDRTVLLRTKTLVDGMTGMDLPTATEQEIAYFDEWLREFEK